MSILLSAIAFIVAFFAWLAARESARQSRKAAQILDREYLAHYAPDLYLWPVESAEGPAWTWKLLNAGRRPALDVRLAPHWGPNQGRHLP